MGAETLDDLIAYVRECLPKSKKPPLFQKNEEQGFVTFHWEGKDLLVRRTLHVVEMRGTQLFITGTSMLLTSVLTKRSKNGMVLEAVLEVLREAENMITTQKRTEAGLKLIGTAKASIARLAGVKISSTPKPALEVATSNAVPAEKRMIDKVI